MSIIRALVMDVDGTLTDGKIYISDDGIEIKSFNVKDGMGIKFLIKNEIIPIILTGRKSKAVSIRCNELKIRYCYQGIVNKLPMLNKLSDELQIPLSEFAYIGDDVNDLEAMRECGLVGVPNDGVLPVKSIADFICKLNGGEGAVREFIDFILWGNKDV